MYLQPKCKELICTGTPMFLCYCCFVVLGIESRSFILSYQYIQTVFIFFFTLSLSLTESLSCAGKALPVSASPHARIINMCHHGWLKTSFNRHFAIRYLGKTLDLHEGKVFPHSVHLPNTWGPSLHLATF